MAIHSPEGNIEPDHFLLCLRRNVLRPLSEPDHINLILWHSKGPGPPKCQVELYFVFQNSRNSGMCVLCSTFFKITCWLHLHQFLEKHGLILLFICSGHLITAGSHLRNVLMALCQYAQLYKNCWDEPAPTAESQKQLSSCLHQENYNLLICHRPAAALGLAMVELVNGA